mmetsp:Transcript_82114/g.129326  ORF Transcript_82114/g.129326 Transcript_82114/m.129326 type:complete len:99 (+) Transcript_82114:791-1087(+)
MSGKPAPSVKEAGEPLAFCSGLPPKSDTTLTIFWMNSHWSSPPSSEEQEDCVDLLQRHGTSTAQAAENHNTDRMTGRLMPPQEKRDTASQTQSPKQYR